MKSYITDEIKNIMQSSQHKLKSYDAIPTFYSFYMIILALEVCDGIENRVLVW